MGGVRTREDPTQPREPDHHHNGQRGVQRREGDLWIQMNWRGELVVRVGWRLTERGLVGREDENGECGEEGFHYCFTPFTYLPVMLSFLSYSVMFQGFEFFHSPIPFRPSGKVIVPCPWYFPSFHSPTYFLPSDQV